MRVEPWQLQPARDTGLTPAERFRSVRRESGLLESVAQQACFSALRIYFAIAHRLRIAGREKLPAHGPFVLAANHCSHLDALVLGAALSPRHRERAFPIAAGDIFFQTTAVSVFSAIMSANAVRQAFYRFRQRYQSLLREEIAHTVATPGDVEDELRHLIAVVRT